jgi:hypothetical protein
VADRRDRPGAVKGPTMRGHKYAAVILALALAVSACGPSGGSRKQSATPGGQAPNEQAKRVAFTKCMREKGIDMPDPKGDGSVGLTGGGDGASQGTALGPQESKFRAAMNQCRHLLPNGGEPTASAADTARALQFARCMRAHGIDVPDPGGNGSVHLDKDKTSIDVKSEKFQAAQRACEKYGPKQNQQQSNGGNG